MLLAILPKFGALLLLLVCLYVFFGILNAIVTNQQLSGQLVSVVIVLALAWWLYLKVADSFAGKAVRHLLGKRTKSSGKRHYLITSPKLCQGCLHYGQCTSAKHGRKIIRLALEELKEKLEEKKKDRKEGDKPNDNVKIEANSKMKYSMLVGVMDACIKAGYSQVGFAPPPDLGS